MNAIMCILISRLFPDSGNDKTIQMAVENIICMCIYGSSQIPHQLSTHKHIQLINPTLLDKCNVSERSVHGNTKHTFLVAA